MLSIWQEVAVSVKFLENGRGKEPFLSQTGFWPPPLAELFR